jgi:hypothetical protein
LRHLSREAALPLQGQGPHRDDGFIPQFQRLAPGRDMPRSMALVAQNKAFVNRASGVACQLFSGD